MVKQEERTIINTKKRVCERETDNKSGAKGTNLCRVKESRPHKDTNLN